MTLFEAIERRHSYRGVYLDLEVPRYDLERIVRAGLRAPTAYNIQTTSFDVIDDAELVAAIAGICGGGRLATAKALIMALIDERPLPGRLPFTLQNMSAALENMLLAITALGYASVWMDDIFLDPVKAAQTTALLRLPAHLRPAVLLPVGVPAQEREQKEKRGFEEMAWYNQFTG